MNDLLNCTQLAERCIPPAQHRLLLHVANQQGLRLALVGGAVRDGLLHCLHRDPWRGLPDLDLLVEDATIPVGCSEPPPAHRLAAALKAAKPTEIGFFHVHSAYGTVELELGGVLMDLASARHERYEEPGHNPEVKPGRLEDDLQRRDFTINAMALVLNPEAANPTLVDPYGGQADLANRCLRLLHPQSIRDDPTRLVRAARYAARLGFVLHDKSDRQVQRTLASWPWHWSFDDPPNQAPPALGTRLRMELELLLEREPWQQGLTLLQRWGGLILLCPNLQRDSQWRRRLHWGARFGLPKLLLLIAIAKDAIALAERLQIPHRQHRLLSQYQKLLISLKGIPKDASPATWCQALEAPGLSADAVALALAAGIQPRRPLLRWLLKWRHVKPPCSAAELMQRERLRPGPELGRRLRELRTLRLNQLE